MAEIPASLAPNAPVQETQPSTPEGPVTVPYGKAEQAILSGQYQVPAGKTVTVRDPSGSAYDLPSDRLKDAIEQGYTIETPEQGLIREHVAANDNAAGALKVGALQFANQLASGIPEIAFEHLANPFQVKKWESLKDSQDIANAIGGVGGFAGSLYVGGPLFKGAAKAGALAERVLAEKLATAGIERGAKGIAKDLLARTVTNAAKFGAEGVVLSAPRAVTEEALGDPNAAAESLLMGGGFGAALGVVAGPTGKMLEKLNLFQQKAEQAGEKSLAENAFRNPAGERTMPNIKAESTGTVSGDAAALGGNDDVVSKLAKGESNLKPNASEIAEAAKTLGLTPLPEQLTSDKAVQDMASAIAQRTDTVIGSQRAAEIQKRFDVYDSTIKSALKAGTEETSAANVGHQIKQDLLKEAKDAIQPVSDFFNILGEDYNKIPVSPKGLAAIAKNIEELQQVRTSVGSAKGLGRRIASALRDGEIKTLEDLKAFTTNIGRDLAPTASANEKSLVAEITEKLRNHEESSIDRYAESILKRTGNAGEATVQKMDELSQLYPKMKEARGRWRDLIENFGDDLEAINGRSSIKSPHQFISEVESLSPEQVAKRFAPKNNVENLNRLLERYPDKVQAVLNLEKYNMLERSLVDGKVNAAKFIREFRKLTPEFRSVLVGEDGVKALNAIRTDLEALPRNVNPSGTAKTIAWNDALFGDGLGKIPNQILKNVQAAVQDAKVRASVSVEGVLAAEKSLLSARSKLEHIGDYIHGTKEAAKNVAKRIKDVGPERPIATVLRLFGEDGKGSKEEAFKKLQEKMNSVAANPQGHAAHLADKTAGLSRTGAPQIAQAYQDRLIKTLSYVQQAMPKQRTVSSPFYTRPYKPSDAEMASFDRKLAVIEDPQVVLKALRDGTLTKDHVESLAVNYPMFYQAMKEKIIDHVTEHGSEMPYQARLKLSLLMGFSADPTTDPAHIAGMQMAYQKTQQNPQNKDGLKVSGLERLNPGEAYATPSEKALARGH